MKKPDDIIEQPEPGEFHKYYSHNFYCCNCHKHNTRWIRKGVRVNGLYITCSNCACSIP